MKLNLKFGFFIILTVSLISGCIDPFEEPIGIEPFGGEGGGGGGESNYDSTFVSGRLYWDFDENGTVEPLYGNTNVWAFKASSFEVDSTSGFKVLTDSFGRYLVVLSGTGSYSITAKKQSTNLQL